MTFPADPTTFGVPLPAAAPAVGPPDDIIPEELQHLIEEIDPLAIPETDQKLRYEIDRDELLQILLDYKNVSREAKESGLSDRNTQWDANWDAYWSRYETKEKAEWQAQETLPEIQNNVDRFTASIRGALMARGEWYTIEDPLKRFPTKLMEYIQKFIDLLLAESGLNASGQTIGFDHCFGQVVKSGALMAMSMSVTWDEKRRRVRVSPVDPRELGYDPTGRGLFRVRTYEMDWHELEELAQLQDDAGDTVYDVEAIDRLQSAADEEGRDDKARSSGTETVDEGTGRKPVVIDEFLCDIVDREGTLVGRNQLIMVANEREIIRGPEPNPFWHGQDWIIFAPTISVPFSVYGRSFVEGFRQLVNTFVEMTNLILDAAFIDALRMFMIWADALDDPSEAHDWWPGKMFVADEDWPAGQDFMKAIESGRLGTGSVQVWQALQAMVRDGSSQNELSMGQIPPKGDITATEISSVDSHQSELVRSIAKDTEDLVLSPGLELVWMTGLQHFDPIKDVAIASELGEDLTRMLTSQREGFRRRRFRFQAYGITGTIRRNERLRNLLGILGILGQNEMMVAAFMKKYSIERVLEEILADAGIDTHRIEKSDLEQRMERQQQGLASLAPGAAAGSTPGARQPARAPAAGPPVSGGVA
jgi:hypothetical protein